MQRLAVTAMALGLSVLSPVAPGAWAQAVTTLPEEEAFGPMMRHRAVLRDVLEQAERQFAQLGSGGDSVSAADLAVHEAFVAAEFGNKLALEIMKGDLDRDGTATEEEIRRYVIYRNRSRARSQANFGEFVEQQMEQWLLKDANGDGGIDWAEVLAPPEPDSPEGRRVASMVASHAQQLRQALALDADGDGKLTLVEYQAAAEALYRSVDTDADGIISAEEQDAFNLRMGPVVTDQARADALAAAEARRAAAMRLLPDGRAKCEMPAASGKANVILAGLHTAEALSSAAIGTQDRAVHTGRLVVEPGDTPIYLVVAAHAAIIWQVSGATERIERLVLTSAIDVPGEAGRLVPIAGATGLPADRVSFLQRTDCLRYFEEVPSTRAAQAVAFVGEAAGKAPAATFGQYAVGTLTVPSGEIQAKSGRQAGVPRITVQGMGSVSIARGTGSVRVTTEGGDAVTELKNFNPGGVVEIDPEAVVAPLPAVPYEVLPQEAGLVQLLEAGALTVNTRGEYLIHRKIRFPADLTGAHAEKFLLLRGVPLPDGDPGHSDVVSEETGELLKLGGR